MNKHYSSAFFIKLPALIFFTITMMISTVAVMANPPGQAADITVTGKVFSAASEPLQGASVSVRKSAVSAITDADGNFSITVPEGSTLIISYVGFQSQQVIARDQIPLTITLQPEANSLNEVVVVGYTTQRKKDLTGAVSLINSKDIANIPVGGVDQILQGKAAGVAVTTASGAPGEGIAVRIRGVGTINNNDPLYIIDGVPTANGINQISPNDIESINILKDAASAAIYGARASNGVVIITTKKGKSGKAKLSFSGYTGTQTAGDLIKMANTKEYVTAYNIAATNDGRTLIPVGMLDTLPDVNWLKEVLKPAPVNNIQMSVSGGNENSQYIVSANYFTQDGLIRNSSYDRFNLRTSVTSSLSKFLKVGTNINLAYSKTRQVGASGDGYGDGNAGASVVRYALFRTPATPVYNKNGDFVDLPNPPAFFGDGLNPVAFADAYNRKLSNYTLLGDAFVEIAPIKNLKIKSDFGVNLILSEFKQFNKTWGIDRFFNGTGSLGQSNSNEYNYNWTNTAIYDLLLDDKNSFTFLAGSEVIKSDVVQTSASRTNYVNQSPAFQYLGNGIGVQQNGGNEDTWALFSLFGRVAYNYDDKYLASFNFRRDGSSRLDPNNRYGNFYSGSVGWRIDKEDFMKNFSKISLLKLRADIGQLGNQAIPNHSYASIISGGNYYPFGGTPTEGYTVSSKGYPNVRWETSTQTDVGIDLGILNNALQITADYFDKKTSGVLLAIPEPSSAGGASSPYVNAGKVENKGVEFEVTYRQTINRKLSYQIVGNFATVQNKVTSLADGRPIVGARIDNGYFATLTTTGHPIGEFYLLQDEGIFQNATEVLTHAYQGPGIQPGDVKYKDIGGPNGKPDGVIDEYDRTFVGSPIPKYTYGVTGTVNYSDFDLSIFFQGVSGNKIYNQILTDIEGFYRSFNITERVANNSWHGEGTSNTLPRLSWNGAANNKRPSTRFLEDGSYLRLKNVQLGYTLNSKILSAYHIGYVRFFVSGQNLLTFTKYTGLDPEMYGNNNSAGDGVRAVGIDWGTYPLARTYTFGLNVNF